MNLQFKVPDLNMENDGSARGIFFNGDAKAEIKESTRGQPQVLAIIISVLRVLKAHPVRPPLIPDVSPWVLRAFVGINCHLPDHR